jgi:hypothetical protein
MQPKPYSTARRSHRQSAAFPVTLLVRSRLRQTEYSGHTVDISLEGARLCCTVILRPGQVIAVVPDEGRAFALRGRVVWVGSPGTERAGLAGLEFLPRPQKPISGWKSRLIGK